MAAQVVMGSSAASQTPAQFKGTNNNHYLSNTIPIVVNRGITGFSESNMALLKKKILYWNKYKSSIGAGSPSACIIWHKGLEDREMMGKGVVFGDEKSIPEDWPARSPRDALVNMTFERKVTFETWLRPPINLSSICITRSDTLWSQMCLIAAMQASEEGESLQVLAVLKNFPIKPLLLCSSSQCPWSHRASGNTLDATAAHHCF